MRNKPVRAPGRVNRGAGSPPLLTGCRRCTTVRASAIWRWPHAHESEQLLISILSTPLCGCVWMREGSRCILMQFTAALLLFGSSGTVFCFVISPHHILHLHVFLYRIPSLRPFWAAHPMRTAGVLRDTARELEKGPRHLYSLCRLLVLNYRVCVSLASLSVACWTARCAWRRRACIGRHASRR